MEKEYYSIDEVAQLVQRNRGTVYNRIRLLGIQTHAFPMDRHKYLTAADVERVKTVIEKPWMAKELGASVSDDNVNPAA